MIHLLAILDIVLVLVFVVRGLDVRLLLFLGAVPLFLAAGQPALFIATLAREMANPKTVIPICSAMGFAYVLRLTECDRHLVLLLVRPLRRMQALLIPGGIAIFELGHDSLPAVQPLFDTPEWTHVGVTNDLAGIPRVIAAERA